MEWSGKWDWDNLVMFNSKASESLKKLQLTDWEIEDGGEIDAAAVSFNLSGNGGSCSDLAHGSSLKSSISASTNSSPEEEEEEGINNKNTSGFSFERTSGSVVIKKRQQQDHQPTRAELSGTSSPLEGSVVSVEPLICLKLGKRTYFENNSSSPTNNNNNNNAKSHSSSVVVVPESSSSSAANVKKTKSAASQNVSSVPLCQVEGCNLDLSSAKEYHKKHRVCDDHSKCPKVIVGGLERRFCQQCSRFHSLSEFDEKKRSCRRRLSDHNARRRKPRQETIQFHSAKLSSSSSSSFYGGRQQMNFALNNGKVCSTKWGEDMLYSSSKFTITKDFPFNPGKGGGGGGGGGGRQPSVPPPIELPFAISPLHSSSNSTCKTTTNSTDLFMQGCSRSSKETMFTNSEQEQLPPRALSLLSTNSSWNEPPDSISFDQHLHLNNPTTTPMMILPSITQGGVLPLVGSSDYWQQQQQQIEQQQHHSLINPQFHYFNSSSSNNNSNSVEVGGGEAQEIQLLKPQQHYHGIYIPMS